MSICAPCQPQSFIGLQLLTYVVHHIGDADQSAITTNHLTLLENVRNAVMEGSPWWSERLYRKHTSDLD